MRIALGIEYDGSAYSGFQRQQSAHTVQAELEKALTHIANEPIMVKCAGRTDAGVHATGQIVHFDTVMDRPEHAWTTSPIACTHPYSMHRPRPPLLPLGPLTSD